VDAHNVVPVWAASGKLEYSARTLRGKVNKVIDEYLVEYPEMPVTAQWNMELPEDVDWEALIDRVFRYQVGTNVLNQMTFCV
jgi:deoxyribodipyrimidine photo-lyase